MGIQFVDPEEAPQPRELVRFKCVIVNPYPDARRIRLGIEVSTFRESPYIEIETYNPSRE